jgi:hypothetical protein
MSVKAYLYTWGMFLLAALVLFLTGNFTMLTAVVFGFMAFGLVFMGMMNVLPLAVAHQSEPTMIKEPKPARVATPEAAPAKAFQVLKSA